MSCPLAFRIIIPARLNSSRLPGKVLLDIGGKSMLQHVYEKALLSNAQAVIIAADSAEIKNIAETFADKVLITSDKHRSGTERIAEAAAQLNLADDEIIVNVQADEPLIPFELINQVANNLNQHATAAIATLYKKLTNKKQLEDPNYVKVVTDKNGLALYFSRSAIPYNGAGYIFHHVGLYAYRVGFIKRYFELEQSPLEIAESLEQLRALWHGYKIHVAETCVQPLPEVNTFADLQTVRNLIAACISET